MQISFSRLVYAYEIYFKVLANNFDVEDYLEKFFY